MPLYEYQCEKCGHRFESIRKVSDPPPDGCPKCGGAVQKLQSAPAFQFKGTGWYITDYARKDQTSASKNGDASKSSSDSSDSKSSASSSESSPTKSATATP